MFYRLLHRLLIVLRRVLLDNPLTRCSLRVLLFLSTILRRQFHCKGPPPPPEKSGDPGGHSDAIAFDLDNSIVCHSAQPRLPSPSFASNQFHDSAATVAPNHAPASHPYPSPGQNASRSSVDVTEVSPRRSTDRLCVSRASGVTGSALSRTPSPVHPLSPSPTQGSLTAAPTPRRDVMSIQGLHPIAADEFERYDRNETTPREYSVHCIPPLETAFNNNVAPPGWTPFIHPEGALYFFHERKKILTDAYLYNGSVLSDLEDFIRQIENHINKSGISLPDDVELVLDLKKNEREDAICGYYFADHTSRYLFWLENYPANDIFGDVKAELSSSHMGHEIESQYWYHGELFPQTRKISTAVINELKDTLNHAIGDLLTSTTSTVVYSLSDLQHMRSLVNDISADVDARSGGSACILSRLMSNFAHERFLNHHGQKTARLYRGQSVHGDAVRERTYLIFLISPILFFAPEVHLSNLEKMSVDQLVNRPAWQHILTKLTSEWQEFTLYATVLLNANVAFLAIQSVDQSGNATKRSFAQRSSYFSIVASIGAIIIGLLLARQHHTKLNIKFLCNRSVSALGLETLAIMYSLPYVLLMWGMVSFLVAFSFMCFNKNDNITYLLISISCATIAFLVVWTVSTSFETKPYWRWWPSKAWQCLRKAAKVGEKRLKFTLPPDQEFASV